MQQRRRLLKANRKPLSSLQQVDDANPSQFNLLGHIENQNLYCKLVTITVQMCREAGVTPTALEQLQFKLLSAKGLNQDLMLNKNASLEEGKNIQEEDFNGYGTESRWMSSSEQIGFLNKMEKEVQEASIKGNFVWALKKYIGEKKKAIQHRFQPSCVLNRKEKFNQKFFKKYHKRGISRVQFYEQSLRDILTKIHPHDDESYQIMGELKYLKSLWGHTFNNQAEEEYCPVYNVLYDKSQKLIVTGGEDGLIKIWSRGTGLLLSSLKGHKQYINKLTITKCNKYILSAAQDSVRFFDLVNMRSIGGYMIESTMDIISIANERSFDVMFADNERLYTVDQHTILAHSNNKLEPHDFHIYSFKDYIKAQTANAIVLAANHNKDVLIGMSSGQILLFNFYDLSRQVEPIGEHFQASVYPLPLKSVIQAHENQILELCWHKEYPYFSTGGKRDGCCRIWDASGSQNSSKPLLIRDIKIPKHKARRKRKNYHCNYILWNCSNTHMACSFQEEEQEDEEGRGDGDVVIWSLQKGEVICEASKEFQLGSIRGLDFHPSYPNVLLFCQSYGKIIIADIFQNAIMNIFEERGFHLNHPSFCLVPTQCHFSSDGLTFLVATQYGNVSIYGYDVKDFYDRNPTEQFFQTDFEGFQIDPETMKPVLNSSIPYDINEMDRGTIRNIRMGQYSHIPSVNAKQFKKILDETNSENRINHKNISTVMEDDVITLRQNTLDYERSLEVYRSGIQEMESKRLTILYQERENKNKKLQDLIQEKSNKMKELEQNQHLLSSLELKAEQPPRAVRNRRLRRPSTNPSRRRAPVTYIPESEQEEKQEPIEESYEVDNEGEQYVENVSEDMLVDEDLEEEQEQLSSLIEPRRRRNRNDTRSRRHDLRRQVRPRRNYRRPEEQFQELEQQYNRIRKRVRTDEVMEEDLCQPLNRVYEYRRPHKRQPEVQIQEEEEYCQECNMRASQVICSMCSGKKLCASCMSNFGKNLAGSYTCFECIYRNNASRERKKNKSDVKYRIQNREIFIPQVDDQVAYFFQGYEEFLFDKVEILNNKQIFENPEFILLPHEKFEELKTPVKCRVKDITYINPLEEDSAPTTFHKRGARGRFTKTVEDVLAFVKLQSPQNQEFSVYFIPGYQFLMKWEIYEDAIKHDRYKKVAVYDIYDLKGEQVQVMRIQPASVRYPESIWKNIVVHKTENINLRRNKQNNEDILVNIWNLKGIINEQAYLYETDFDVDKKDEYYRQILKVRDQSSDIWGIFKDFVNTELYPDYYESIEIGICLNIILKRLENNYYKNQESFIKDINQIHENSIKYNGEGTFVTLLAQKLTNIILFNEPLIKEEEMIPLPVVQVPASTERKPTTKVKKSTVRDIKLEEEQQQVPMVQEFVEPEPENKRELRKRRLRKISDEDEFKEEEFHNDDDEYGYTQQRRATRNHTKSYKISNTSSVSSRITRSRNKR